MEKRKESLSALKLCRFCLTENESLGCLYNKHRSDRNSVDFPLKILSCVSIEVFPSDKMPSFMCDHCQFFMDLFYQYKQMVRRADENILNYIRNGTELESVPWPSSLITVYQESIQHGVVKTIVEGGATVHVSTHDGSDSDDEEDENVFNVTIADGSDDGSKGTCIKVVTSKDNKDSSNKQDSKDGNIVEIKEKVVEEISGSLNNGCWPCLQCDCTYPLQQQLELHKKRKHRERMVRCDHCDAKFFNKYDLATHQVRHSEDQPLKCVACDKTFKLLYSLKHHQKVVHSELLKKVCPKCPATFLNDKELEVHKRKHHLYPRILYGCGIKYSNKASLDRHKKLMVSKDHYSCEYCPQRFTSRAKLVSHVRTHAGDRQYPCKHCDKSFVKSHHYTRHLRLKHRDNIRLSRGTFGHPDQYRCEQCDDSFTTQDELIYHSAIHATQNLTCPLCQEKFDNVDAVTTHIKSHVNGIEFMCDFCELVFTTKAKLDSHIEMAHEDEFNNELEQDESSIDMDAEDDEDDNSINVKDEGDHMVIEIKKADDYMLNNTPGDSEEKCDNTNSDDSEAEVTYTELSTVDTLAIIKKESLNTSEENPSNFTFTSVSSVMPAIAKNDQTNDTQTTEITKKVEEIEGKQIEQQSADTEKKKKTKADSNVSVGASNKSLQLLEKELQELKRTNNTRIDINKAPAKSTEPNRGRRPLLHTSTPKIKSADEKRTVIGTKSPVTEKKIQERRTITKENKEPKEIKASNSSIKEDKDIKERATTPTPKSVIKNGNEKNLTDEGIRRSTRPSKIKDYAKMIRDRSHPEEEDTDDGDDEEYKAEKTPERTRSRKITKTNPKMIQPAVASTSKVIHTPPAPTTRKRGRPRKEATKEVPLKVKKDGNETNEENISNKIESEESGSTKDLQVLDDKNDVAGKSSNYSEYSSDEAKASNTERVPNTTGILVSPTGRTLKKVPAQALPPGVKPLLLPSTARPITTGELSEMKIGKRMVKVQKIVMTKAEVEAMAKKGLVEMKDGTMVLKQGIKLPTCDPATLKSTLIGEADGRKESPQKKEKATPSRCNLDDDAY